MEIQQTILQIISNISGIAAQDIPFSADLRNDLGINSLEGLTLIINIEEAFDISVADQDVQHITTVQDVFRYVEYYLSKENRSNF